MSYQEKISDIRQQGGINFHFPVLKEGGVKPGIWSHICMSYDSDKRHFAMVHNGKIEVNYTNAPLAFEVHDGFPKSAFTPVSRAPGGIWSSPFWNCTPKPNLDWIEPCEDEEKPLMRNRGRIFLAMNHHFAGYLTDSNLWSRPLTIDEMIDWTTCKSFEKGNLQPWNREDWRPTVVDENGDPAIVHDEVLVDTAAFCSSPSPNGKTYTIFADDIYTHDNAMLLCRQFGGDMAHTTTLEEDQIVRNFLQDVRDKSSLWYEITDKNYWYRYRDDEIEGVWDDPVTGFIASFMNCPDDPSECYSVIPWELNHQPEGGPAENCCLTRFYREQDASTYDITCAQEDVSVICEGISTEIKLRGLCPISNIGKKYLMSPDPLEKRRFFKGYTGWTLKYENNIWSISNERNPEISVEYRESMHYPMGRKSWKVTNDICTGNYVTKNVCLQLEWSGPAEETISLMLTACKDDEFTCDDGTCIHMNSRCDRKEDCTVSFACIL